MGLFAKLKNFFSFDDSEGIINWQHLLGRGSTTITGTHVDRRVALSLASVYRGVDLISSTIGRCSCITYKSTPGNGREHYRSHEAYRLLYGFANPAMPSNRLVEYLVSSALLHGNGFAYIEKNEAGLPVALWPLDPSAVCMTVIYRGENLSPEIFYQAKGIGTEGQSTKKTLRADEVIHLKGLGESPWLGQGLLDVARETVGLASDVANFAAYYIGNGGVIQLVVEMPGQLKTEEQREDFAAQFERRHTGIQHAFRPAYIPPGTKVTTLSVDAEALALDKLADRLDRAVANFLGLPPHIVGTPGIGSSYGSIDAENASMNGNLYDKWFTRLETEFELKLCTELEKNTGRAFVEFDRSTLLSADENALTTRIVALYGADLITREEARLDLNKPTEPEGKFKSDTQPEPVALPAPQADEQTEQIPSENNEESQSQPVDA